MITREWLERVFNNLRGRGYPDLEGIGRPQGKPLKVHVVPIRVVSFKGTVVTGRASMTEEKRPHVTVLFDERIFIPYDRKTTDGYWSTSESFYATGDYAGMMHVWGQGQSFPRATWLLHPDDLAKVQ